MESRESRDLLNSALCDELLADILSKACDPSDRDSVSLVCKRWLRVQRHAKWKLGLCMPDDASLDTFCAAVPSLIAQHPYLTCLSIKPKWTVLVDHPVTRVVRAISASCTCLRRLRFTAVPISACGLEDLSQGCPQLYFLEILQPLANCLPALSNFTSLQELTIHGHVEDAMCAGNQIEVFAENTPDAKGTSTCEPLQIMKLTLINVKVCMSCDLRWLWKSCGQLQKLELYSCDGVGDMAAMSAFAHALTYVQELKVHRCRGIAGKVLAMASRHTLGLKVLTVYDGADTMGLQGVLQRCKGLEFLDLRLPLDLSKEDLLHIGVHGKRLRTLRLHSCWLATGTELQLLASHINPRLEELVLTSCRAIFQDPGTLSAIGQSLVNLRSIDLSQNEYLADKELAAMLAACENVHILNLCKCCRLTDRVADFIAQKCVHLESIDIRSCDAISTQAVTNLLMGCGHLVKIAVETSKLSISARKIASLKRIALI